MKHLKIFELFDSNSYEVYWVQQYPDYWRGEFFINNTNYSLSCIKENDYYNKDEPEAKSDFWEMAFVPTENSFDDSVIGTGGNQYKIFSIVVSGMREFVKEVRPEYIMISGTKKQPKRVRLYSKMADLFNDELAEMGYNRCEAPLHPYFDTSEGYETFCWRS